MAVSGIHNGWRYDPNNSRLDVYFRGTRIGHVDAGGLALAVGNVEVEAGTIHAQDGGTVTQATNKATTVVLSTNSGQITMNAAGLAANAEVSFTVTNTTVAATDVVAVCHGSAGTAGAYNVGANTIASGSFKITVGNVSTGTLSEAIVINFVVLKGASS